MDTKNIIAAISLSLAIIVMWSLFFQPSPEEIKKRKEKEKIVNSSDAPNIDTTEKITNLSREEALKLDDRFYFENESIKGSISLKGAAIDDLIFKKYKTQLDSDEFVTLLNPKSTSNGYYIESGWVSNNKNIDIPDNKTIWKIEGNSKLTPNNDVTLIWKNNQGLTFEKIIKIDNQYLFAIEQKIKNSSDKIYSFYPYAQIIRTKIPEIIDFLILHEGPLGVLDDELIEKDYKNILDEKYSKNANNGFLGITDKYWLTSIIPQKNKKFRADFEYNEKFKVNYIETDQYESKPNTQISNLVNVVVAAKEVNVIDGYNESLGLKKFDLVIDWGFLYFLTKPLWYALDYFFKMFGNYGLAIIAVTVCTRLAVFPLANYSFKSMAKMKALQPEMLRLRELNKSDKMKLQQSMMALYKKEGVNPMSGCLPIIPQIFIFFSLYKVLFVTIEMRQMPFYGYLKDLSERDPTSVFNLFGLLPYDVPSFLVIGALPIAMGLSMFAQQKLNPAPTDPVQAKIFAFFPLFLTVILAPFPSGLVLFWFVNNCLTMLQQVFIMKRTTVKTVT